MLKDLTIGFIEYGKSFAKIEGGYLATDFSILAYSNEVIIPLEKALRDKVLRYPNELPVWLNSEPISTGLIRFFEQNCYVFVQLQRRKELELARSKPNNTALQNRTYNQIRFTLIDRKFYEETLLSQKNILRNLLVDAGSLENNLQDTRKYGLKNYLQTEKQKSSILDVPDAFSITASELEDYENELLISLTNLIYEKFFTSNASLKIAIVFPLVLQFDVLKKLRIMEHVQYFVFPFLGAISFSTDYFCDQVLNLIFINSSRGVSSFNGYEIFNYEELLPRNYNQDYHRFLTKYSQEGYSDFGRSLLSTKAFSLSEIQELFSLVNGSFHDADKSYKELVVKYLTAVSNTDFGQFLIRIGPKISQNLLTDKDVQPQLKFRILETWRNNVGDYINYANYVTLYTSLFEDEKYEDKFLKQLISVTSTVNIEFTLRLPPSVRTQLLEILTNARSNISYEQTVFLSEIGQKMSLVDFLLAVDSKEHYSMLANYIARGNQNLIERVINSVAQRGSLKDFGTFVQNFPGKLNPNAILKVIKGLVGSKKLIDTDIVQLTEILKYIFPGRKYTGLINITDKESLLFEDKLYEFVDRNSELGEILFFVSLEFPYQEFRERANLLRKLVKVQSRGKVSDSFYFFMTSNVRSKYNLGINKILAEIGERERPKFLRFLIQSDDSLHSEDLDFIVSIATDNALHDFLFKALLDDDKHNLALADIGLDSILAILLDPWVRSNPERRKKLINRVDWVRESKGDLVIQFLQRRQHEFFSRQIFEDLEFINASISTNRRKLSPFIRKILSVAEDISDLEPLPGGVNYFVLQVLAGELELSSDDITIESLRTILESLLNLQRYHPNSAMSRKIESILVAFRSSGSPSAEEKNIGSILFQKLQLVKVGGSRIKAGSSDLFIDHSAAVRETSEEPLGLKDQPAVEPLPVESVSDFVNENMNKDHTLKVLSEKNRQMRLFDYRLILRAVLVSLLIAFLGSLVFKMFLNKIIEFFVWLQVG